VVHAAHDRPGAVLAARTGAAAARAPLVVDWYDATGDEPGGRLRSAVADRLRRRAARAPARVVAPSRLVQTGVRELGVPESRTAVVPTGLDLDLIDEVEPEDGGDVVYSRTLDADANLESLLLALAEFRTRDWRAVVIGDGPERESYERQARDLRIDDRVAFVGEQPLERRLALFRGAHVYVHTARRTPFAADLARALACGCVGVAEYHADSAAHELVERRARGLLVTDDGELVECLRAAADLERRDRDGGVDDLGVDAVRRRYLDLYEDLRGRGD
jgi:glycosyltransferase involved in cell wall biosynthesis